MKRAFTVQSQNSSLKDDGHHRFLLILALGAIIVAAAAARCYHLDYPAIGYHNVKEHEYIGIAKFMIKDADIFHRKSFNLGQLDVPYFEEYPQFPLIPLWIAFLRQLNFEELWPVRLLSVFASCLNIFLLYRIVRAMGGSVFIGLSSALFFGIFPLSIFFGRNIQPEALALACMLSGTLLFLRWRHAFENKFAFGMVLLWGIGGLLKLTFFILVVPLVFLLPYNRLLKKDYLSHLPGNMVACALGLLPFILWNVITVFTNKIATLTEQTQHRVKPWEVLTAEYWAKSWPPVYSYLDENFTLPGLILILLGLALSGFLVSSKVARSAALVAIGCVATMAVSLPVPIASASSGIGFSGVPQLFACAICVGYFAVLLITISATRNEELLPAYLGGSVIALLPYAAILSDFISQHNYYHYPFLPMVCLAATIPLLILRNLLAQRVSGLIANAIPCLAVALLLPSIVKNTARMFDTQFLGCDVGGKYLKHVMPENERFFMFGSHQSVGFGSYSERVCIVPGTFPNMKISFEDFQKYQEKFNIQWIAIDVLNFGIPIMNLDPRVLQYVQQNYGLNGVGVIKEGDKMQIATLILKKPGRFNLSNIASDPVFLDAKPSAHKYENSKGPIEYLFISSK